MSKTGVLSSLFHSITGTNPDSITTLSASGSHRRYYRLVAGKLSLIGVVGVDKAENETFLTMSDHFAKAGLNVPKILAVSEDKMVYLQEDLGDKVLYDMLAKAKSSPKSKAYIESILIKTVQELARFQVLAAKGFDFNKCFFIKEFNQRLVMFDLNYFKYNYLKLTGLNFKEALLQDDFEQLCEDLLAVEGEAFLYRDFQSRNVMIKDDKPYFIDYQGGFKGPLHYDLASFVWQAKAAYSGELREKLVSAYIESLKLYKDFDELQFRKNLRLFVLFRTLQVLGAYGFRGLYEKKKHFIESIPYALANLRDVLTEPFEDYPYLTEVLKDLSSESGFKNIESILNRIDSKSKCCKKQDLPEKRDFLEVQVVSFSYKKGLPEDESLNGGGYIFDCRALHNPGRYDEYKSFTGRDESVIKFLEEKGEILPFLENVYNLVDTHVECFLCRKFTHIMVAFGCTGGQHRSVYCAEAMAKHLVSKYGVRVHLIHREQGIDIRL